MSAEIGAPLWPRVDPREAGTSRSQAICIHGMCAHPLLQFPPGGCWQRRDREILFCDPSFSQSSSALPSFLSELLAGYTRKCFSFHRSFISPSALAASSSSRRACMCACQSRGFGYLVCLRVWPPPPPSKQAKRASDTRGPYLAKCREDNLPSVPSAQKQRFGVLTF